MTLVSAWAQTERQVLGVEGESVTLPCHGHQPDSSMAYYRWYKHNYRRGHPLLSDTEVAYSQRVRGMVVIMNHTKNELQGRAWLHPENGSLTITSLNITDEHWYMCKFSLIGGFGKVNLSVHGKCLIDSRFCSGRFPSVGHSSSTTRITGLITKSTHLADIPRSVIFCLRNSYRFK